MIVKDCYLISNDGRWKVLLNSTEVLKRSAIRRYMALPLLIDLVLRLPIGLRARLKPAIRICRSQNGLR